MADYDNTNRGGMFKNTNKANPNHADWGGNINVDGTDYFLNAWVKDDKNGNKYFSLSVKRKDKQQAAAAPVRAAAPAPRVAAELNDDVPF